MKLSIIPSSRFQAFIGDAETLAIKLIQNPKVIGPHRATMLLNLAQTNRNGRVALQACARQANRHFKVLPDGTTACRDRVFNKASTKRLANWAQNRNSMV